MKTTDSGYDFPPEHYMPFPEIILGNPEPYQIYDSLTRPWLPTTGITDKVNRRLWVPFDHAGVAVRAHESAHVWLSPKHVSRVSFDARFLQAVEDARINLGTRNIGFPCDFTDAERARVVEIGRGDLEAGDPMLLVLRWIASIGTNACYDMSELLAREAPETHVRVAALVADVEACLERARRRRGEPAAPYSLGLRLARSLARELGAPKTPIGAFGQALGIAMGDACCGGLCMGAPAVEGGNDATGVLMGEIPYAALVSDRTVDPGRMTIRRPPLPRACRNLVRSRRARRKPVREGTAVYFMGRFPVDGAIFGRRPRSVAAGTVLVDTSGSMHLGPTEIDRIVEAAAVAATVAIYSGRLDVGELRIVARAGCRASDADLAPFAGGNVIDLPALGWLARQPEPRIWISDGEATGIGDRGSPALRERCKRTCKRARIRRVVDVAAAVAILRGAA